VQTIAWDLLPLAAAVGAVMVAGGWRRGRARDAGPLAARSLDIPPLPTDLLDLERLRVLVVSTDAEDRQLAAMVLRDAGISVEVADGGEAGLECVRKAELGDEPFDLILLDLELEDGDGCSVAQELRRGGCDSLVLGLARRLDDDRRARALAAGCDSFLARPLQRRTLVPAVIGQLETARRRRAALAG
jgi:DNA-binding response OmpR family regulator